MNFLKLRLWARSLTLVAILLSGEPAVASPRDEAEGWIELKGSHFTLFTDSRPRQAKRIAGELEAFGGLVRRLHPGFALETLRPIHLFLFDQQNSFKAHAPKGSGPIVSRGVEANYMALNGSDSSPLASAYYAYAHHILANNDPRMPLWLSEGLANYLQVFTRSSDMAYFAGAHPRWQRGLQFDSWMSLEQLFSVTARSEAYRDEEQNLRFQAQSWALVHYLFDRDDQRRHQTVLAMAQIAAGQPSAQALTTAHGKSLEQLQSAVRNANRLRRSAHYQSISVRDLGIQDDFKTRPLGLEEALCRLGALLLSGDAEQLEMAEHYFDEALTVAPESSEATVGKAAARLGLGGSKEAATLLKTAIEREPSAHAYFLLGRSLMHGLDDDTNPIGGGPTPPSILQARAAFQKALQLDPKLIAAYAQLGKTYLYDSESQQPGIDLMNNVLARVPRVDIALTLIELHSRRGDREAAHGVRESHLVPLVNALSHRPLEPIDWDLMRAELRVADAWAAEGRPQDALTLVKKLQKETEDPDLERAIAERIRNFQGSGTESTDL